MPSIQLLPASEGEEWGKGGVGGGWGGERVPKSSQVPQSCSQNFYSTGEATLKLPNTGAS